MFKKVLSALALVAFVFGATTFTNIPEDLTDTGPCICCDHNGDGWDN